MRWQAWSPRDEMLARRPAWWALYLIAVLVVAVVGIEEACIAGAITCRILETITVVVGFGSISVWLRFNRIALDLERGRRRA
jgi:hypothetical protein